MAAHFDSPVLAVDEYAVSTRSGNLELLGCCPDLDEEKAPVLCLHGAFCSAKDYRNMLPFLASHGHPAYSLSLRGHGKSWSMSWIARTAFTTIDDYVADIMAAAAFIKDRHPSAPPMVLVGHSFGGGHLQYLLAHRGRNGSSPIEFGGLVLLAAAPLSGGGREIMANWEMVEAPGGYPYPWSPRSQLDTPERVRAAFFTPETSEEVIASWLADCRTVDEGLRTGLSVFWPFGEAADVMGGLVGLGCNMAGERKVLLVAGQKDRLVTPEMVGANARVYRDAVADPSQGESSTKKREVVVGVSIPGSAHHLMMDVGWKACACSIVDWIKGDRLSELTCTTLM